MKKVLVVVALLLVGFVAIVATRPPEFHIERSVTIAAPASIVFAQVNDFRSWQAWSPWEKLDPQMQRTHEGAASGVGAIYTWKGNDKVGEGKMTIVESVPNERMVARLEFIKPFAATNSATFVLRPQGQDVALTWAMDGKNNFVSKAFGLVMNMDEMVGKDFEQGLAALKTVSEQEAKRVSAASDAAAQAPQIP